jgi:hypothetical protein
LILKITRNNKLLYFTAGLETFFFELGACVGARNGGAGACRIKRGEVHEVHGSGTGAGYGQEYRVRERDERNDKDARRIPSSDEELLLQLFPPAMKDHF